MSYSIHWTTSSHEQLIDLVRFIDRKWGSNVVARFISQLKSFLKVIEDMPEAFPEINKRMKWRRCVVTKRTVLFYKIQDKTIIISGIYDTRMNPDSFII